ncbi:MAG: polyhydroxyalkanoate synthesis repressor PhaR [Pseudomonadota bacterium]
MARQKQNPSSTDQAGRRVIKKYPNRRLYDTATSSYITLSEVKQMVIDHVDLVVQDAKTREDLTRSILLQIILEEETAGVPLFSESSLANIIRFYGLAMPATNPFVQGFNAYTEQMLGAMGIQRTNR